MHHAGSSEPISRCRFWFRSRLLSLLIPAEAHFSSRFLLSLASLTTLLSICALLPWGCGWGGGAGCITVQQNCPRTLEVQSNQLRSVLLFTFSRPDVRPVALRRFPDNEDDLVLTLWQISEGAVVGGGGGCFGFPSLDAEGAACLVPGLAWFISGLAVQPGRCRLDAMAT